MESRAKLLGHPVHPMLIVFPLGLLATAVAFDIFALVQSDSSWFHISFWMIAAGIIGGLCAAVFGLVDWLAIPNGTRAKRIGLWHGGLNVLVVLLFAISWFIRKGGEQIPSNGALVHISFWMIAAGIIGGLCAAVFGLVDWLAIPNGTESENGG